MTATLTDLREHYGVRQAGFRAPVAVRLLRNVVDDDGCWIWQGALSDGYGRVRESATGPLAQAHRVAYSLLVGPIPDDLQLDHRCRRRACVRPEHLEPVTGRENTLRGHGVTAVNAAKTHCHRDHPFTAENTVVRQGRRYCQTCVRLRNAERKHLAAIIAAGKQPPARPLRRVS